jgi:phospholipid/cholesterol/gamma-HCH transport system substrate-binding protein
MKSFTERNPRRIGLAVVALTVAGVLAVLFLNRGIFASTYTIDARFPDTAGVGPGTNVLVAGVNVGSVSSVHIQGNHVDVDLAINRGVQLPRHTTAAISVQTLLGQLSVNLKPVSGWNQLLQNGAVLTSTSTPVELYNIQNEAGGLFSNTDAAAINNLIESLASITQGKKTQVQQIVNGLNRFTGVVDQRSGQVSQLIDAANTLSSTVNTRDAQLGSAIDNLSTVVTGLAQHGSDLGNLIDNTQQAAAQIQTLVGTNSPQLSQTLSHLESVLGVLSNHQVDLAQGVSSLATAVTGFSSVGYSGPQNTPNSWANIYVNLVGASGAYGVLGACGTLDQVLNQTLGPDPLPCDQQSGPLASGAGATSLPGSTSATPATSTPSTTSPSAPTTSVPGGTTSSSGIGGILGLGSGSTGSGSSGSGSTGSGSGGGLGNLLPSLLGGSS